MPEADDIINLTQGPYRLRAPLGGSAYGVVWRAAAPHGQPDVALKLVNRSQMARAHPSVQTRWIDSADTEASFLRALAPWDQRHIVRLIDSGAHQGLPVMALELLGENLGQHLESERHAGRSPGLARALGWIAQLNHHHRRDGCLLLGLGTGSHCQYRRWSCFGRRHRWQHPPSQRRPGRGRDRRRSRQLDQQQP